MSKFCPGAALAILATLLATPAMADGGVKKPSTGSATAAAVPPGTCTREQLTVIDEAFTTARERVQAALAFIDERPEDPHIRRWFGTTPRKVVRHHFALIDAGLHDGGRPRLRCNDPEACPQGHGSRFAYARQSDRLLGFCHSFFSTGTRGQDARFGVVVHELSHIVVGTRDAAYQPRGAESLAKDEPLVAAMNADNYEYFVEFLPD